MNLHEQSLSINDDQNNFVTLSRRLRLDGDSDHAERLLISGLKRVESNLQNEELALLEILKELLSLYSEQGRIDEQNVLSDRIEQLSQLDILSQSKNLGAKS